jgi:hypothetical protein
MSKSAVRSNLLGLLTAVAYIVLIAAIFGSLIVCVLALPYIWHFLQASWPTWGVLLLALILFAFARHYESHIAGKAAAKVLSPVLMGLPPYWRSKGRLASFERFSTSTASLV